MVERYSAGWNTGFEGFSKFPTMASKLPAKRGRAAAKRSRAAARWGTPVSAASSGSASKVVSAKRSAENVAGEHRQALFRERANARGPAAVELEAVAGGGNAQAAHGTVRAVFHRHALHGIVEGDGAAHPVVFDAEGAARLVGDALHAVHRPYGGRLPTLTQPLIPDPAPNP